MWAQPQFRGARQSPKAVRQTSRETWRGRVSPPRGQAPPRSRPLPAGRASSHPNPPRAHPELTRHAHQPLVEVLTMRDRSFTLGKSTRALTPERVRVDFFLPAHGAAPGSSSRRMISAGGCHRGAPRTEAENPRLTTSGRPRPPAILPIRECRERRISRSLHDTDTAGGQVGRDYPHLSNVNY
jgi:hypothetical protein